MYEQGTTAEWPNLEEKTAGGVIETDVSVSGRLEVSREEASTSAGIEAALELEERGQLMFVHVE